MPSARRQCRGAASTGVTGRADRRLPTPRCGPRRAAARPGMRGGRHAFQAVRLGARVVALDAQASEVAPGARHHRGHARRRRGARPTTRPGWSRATPCTCPSPTAASTGSSPPRCSSTSPKTTRPWPSCRGCCAPGAPWPSPCRGSVPRPSTGRCRTSTTTSPAATSGSTGVRPCSSGSGGPGCVPSTAITPTRCTRRTGGCAAGWARAATTTRLCAAYHRLLVWDITRAPRLTRVSRARAQPPARQEPRRLPGEARMTRTEGAFPLAVPVRRWNAESGRRPPGGGRDPRGPRRAQAHEVVATAASIAAVQRHDGMIPWFEGGHCDPWNHVEAAMAPERRRVPQGGHPGLPVAGRQRSSPTARGSTTTWPAAA